MTPASTETFEEKQDIEVFFPGGDGRFVEEGLDVGFRIDEAPVEREDLFPDPPRGVPRVLAELQVARGDGPAVGVGLDALALPCRRAAPRPDGRRISRAGSFPLQVRTERRTDTSRPAARPSTLSAGRTAQATGRNSPRLLRSQPERNPSFSLPLSQTQLIGPPFPQLAAEFTRSTPSARSSAQPGSGPCPSPPGGSGSPRPDRRG